MAEPKRKAAYPQQDPNVEPDGWGSFLQGVKDFFTGQGQFGGEANKVKDRYAIETAKDNAVNPPPSQDGRPTIVTNESAPKDFHEQIFDETPAPTRVRSKPVKPYRYQDVPAKLRPAEKPKHSLDTTVEEPVPQASAEPTSPPPVSDVAAGDNEEVDDEESDPLLKMIEKRARKMATNFRPAIDWGPFIALTDKWYGGDQLRGYTKPGTPLQQYADLSDQIRKWHDSRTNKRYREAMEDIKRQELSSKMGVFEWAVRNGFVPPGLSRSMGGVEADANLKNAQAQKIVDLIPALQQQIRAATDLNDAKRQNMLERLKMLDGEMKKKDADVAKVQAETDRIRRELEVSKKTGLPPGRAPSAARGGNGAGSALKGLSPAEVQNQADLLYQNWTGRPKVDKGQRAKADYIKMQAWLNKAHKDALADKRVKTQADLMEYLQEARDAYLKKFPPPQEL